MENKVGLIKTRPTWGTIKANFWLFIYKLRWKFKPRCPWDVDRYVVRRGRTSVGFVEEEFGGWVGDNAFKDLRNVTHDEYFPKEDVWKKFESMNVWK